MRWRSALVLPLALAASGCMSLSVFQPPEALDRGEMAVGVGATALRAVGDTASDSNLALLPEANLRVGVGGGVDAGLKFAGFPPLGALYGDVRWQFLEVPLPVTAGLGASYAGWGGSDGSEGFSFAALYPTLAVGTDRLWVAGRGVVITAGAPWEDALFSSTIWGIVAGTRIGGRFRLLPEVELYVGDGGTMLGLGMGVQFGVTEGDEADG